MEWLHRLDKESLLELLESLDRPAWAALEAHLQELRQVAAQELLESQVWDEFRETRGGIRVLDALLEIRAGVHARIETIEQETAYGYDVDRDGSDRGGQAGY